MEQTMCGSTPPERNYTSPLSDGSTPYLINLLEAQNVRHTDTRQEAADALYRRLTQHGNFDSKGRFVPDSDTDLRRFNADSARSRKLLIKNAVVINKYRSQTEVDTNQYIEDEIW